MTCMLLFVRHESRAAAVLSPKIVRRRLDIATSSDRQDDLLQIIATTEEEAGAGYHSAEEEAGYHLAAEEEARSLKVAAEVEVGFRQSHSSGRVGPDLGVGQKERRRTVPGSTIARSAVSARRTLVVAVVSVAV
jgi:hypothetical protein